MSTLVPILGPIATLAVGCAVAFIAWQQWQLARNKLRLDLFDRRYKVYDATRKFLAIFARDYTFTDSQLGEFAADTSEAEFLFGSDVVDYLAQIRTGALDRRTRRERAHQEVLQMPADEQAHQHAKAAEAEQQMWLDEQITAMTKTFTPYLGFSRIQ